METAYEARHIKILKNSLKDDDSKQIVFPLLLHKIIKFEIFYESENEKQARIIIAPKFNYGVQLEVIVTGVAYYSVNEEVVHGDNIEFEGRLDILVGKDYTYVFEYVTEIFVFTAKGVFIREAKYIEHEDTKEPI